MALFPFFIFFNFQLNRVEQIVLQQGQSGRLIGEAFVLFCIFLLYSDLILRSDTLICTLGWKQISSTPKSFFAKAAVSIIPKPVAPEAAVSVLMISVLIISVLIISVFIISLHDLCIHFLGICR